jgi:hypothetical protein
MLRRPSIKLRGSPRGPLLKPLREAIAAAEKEAKKGKKPGKSKVITPPLLLTKTSTASPSQNPASGIPLLHSSQCQDYSSSHHHPSWTLQEVLCMFRSSSSLGPYCPLMGKCMVRCLTFSTCRLTRVHIIFLHIKLNFFIFFCINSLLYMKNN